MENYCLYYEECKNKDNILKCGRCENNNLNFDKIEKEEQAEGIHDRRNKRFYIYADNFEDY